MAGLAARQMKPAPVARHSPARLVRTSWASLLSPSAFRATASREMTSAPAPAWGLRKCPPATSCPEAVSTACQYREVVPRSTARAMLGREDTQSPDTFPSISADTVCISGKAADTATGGKKFSAGISKRSKPAPAGTVCRQARRQPAASSSWLKTASSAGNGAGGGIGVDSDKTASAGCSQRTRQRPQRPSPLHRGKGRTLPESQMARDKTSPLTASVSRGAAPAATSSNFMRPPCPKAAVKARASCFCRPAGLFLSKRQKLWTAPLAPNRKSLSCLASCQLGLFLAS